MYRQGHAANALSIVLSQAPHQCHQEDRKCMSDLPCHDVHGVFCLQLRNSLLREDEAYSVHTFGTMAQ